MKMGTTCSPWRYDAAANQALQSANLRRLEILRYATWAAVFPIFAGWSGYPSIAALSINPWVDEVGEKETSRAWLDYACVATVDVAPRRG
jgi:hypothetical protein